MKIPSFVSFVHNLILHFRLNCISLYYKIDICSRRCNDDDLCKSGCALSLACQTLLNNGYDLCDNGFSLCLLTNKDETICLITRSLCYQKWDQAQERCLNEQNISASFHSSTRPKRDFSFSSHGRHSWIDVLEHSISVCFQSSVIPASYPILVHSLDKV